MEFCKVSTDNSDRSVQRNLTIRIVATAKNRAPQSSTSWLILGNLFFNNQQQRTARKLVSQRFLRSLVQLIIAWILKVSCATHYSLDFGKL